MFGNRHAARVVAIGLALAVSAIAIGAQEEGMPEMTPEMQAEMAAWMKLAQPGDHHKHLAPLVGTWKGEAQMWMAPDAEPMVEETTTEAAWIMGGRFLEWKQTGFFGQMPYEGRAIEGYNNGDERYEGMWIDNFGTLMLIYEGSCSDDGKTREMKTSFSDPIAGGTIKYRSVYTWVDDDHFNFEAFMDKGEGEFRSMKIAYERQ